MVPVGTTASTTTFPVAHQVFLKSGRGQVGFLCSKAIEGLIGCDFYFF